jgi:uncharacterized membrane protein YqjE
MRIYLFLALFWLVVALFVLIYPLFYRDMRDWANLSPRVSMGWLVLVFVGWNLVRWRLTRPLRQARPQEMSDDNGAEHR